MKSQLYIKETKGKGRGVFSAVAIEANELIEVCPLLILKPEDFEYIKSTFIINYCFFYNPDENLAGLATGFGSLYNHESPANARHQVFKEEKTVHIIAVRNIAADEEISINYHGQFDDDSTIWFTSRGIPYHP